MRKPDVVRIREALVDERVSIVYRCLNREEAELIRAELGPEPRVQFTYLVWGGYPVTDPNA